MCEDILYAIVSLAFDVIIMQTLGIHLAKLLQVPLGPLRGPQPLTWLTVNILVCSFFFRSSINRRLSLIEKFGRIWKGTIVI